MIGVQFDEAGDQEIAAQVFARAGRAALADFGNAAVGDGDPAALEDRVNPLGMVPDADVQRVLFAGEGDSRRAIGVEVRMRSPIAEAGTIADPNGLKIPVGETFVVRADTIILSAGALGSPTVLMRSGVKNKQIGRGVVLHPSVPIMGRFSHHIDVLTGTEASVYVDDRLADRGYALESMADQPLYAAIMSPGPALHSYEMINAFRNLAGFGVMLIDTPQGENRIRLAETSAGDLRGFSSVGQHAIELPIARAHRREVNPAAVGGIGWVVVFRKMIG